MGEWRLRGKWGGVAEEGTPPLPEGPKYKLAISTKIALSTEATPNFQRGSGFDGHQNVSSLGTGLVEVCNATAFCFRRYFRTIA